MIEIVPSPEVITREGYAFDWGVVVFAASEADNLGPCLQSIAAARQGRRVCVTVMLNGSRDNSLDVLQQLDLPDIDIRVWSIQLGDKANAINAYLHEVRPHAALQVLMDAYVRIEADALVELEAALVANSHAHIASGMPQNGRSAHWYRGLLLGGGHINGNLYALRERLVQRLVEAGYRLPLGLYRTDPLLGAMAAHDLDAPRTAWDARRLIGVATASYWIKPLSPLRWQDIRRQWRREINQARGAIENAALRELIGSAGFGRLPDRIEPLLLDWLARHRPRPASWRQWASLPLAIRELRTRSNGRLMAPDEQGPVLVLSR